MIKRALQYEKILPFQLTLAECRLFVYRGLKLEKIPNENYQTLIARIKTWLEHWKTTAEGKEVAKTLVRDVRASPLRCILLDGLHRLAKERDCLQAELTAKQTAADELRALKHSWFERRRKLGEDQHSLNQALLTKTPEIFPGDDETRELEERWEDHYSTEARAEAWAKVLEYRHARVERQLEMDVGSETSQSILGERWALAKQRLAALEACSQGGTQIEKSLKEANDALKALNEEWRTQFSQYFDAMKKDQQRNKEAAESAECKRIKKLLTLSPDAAFESEKARYLRTEEIPSWNELVDLTYEERAALAGEVRDLQLDVGRINHLIDHTASRNRFLTFPEGKAGQAEIAVPWDQWKPSEVHDVTQLGRTEFRVGLSKVPGDRETFKMTDEPWKAGAITTGESSRRWQAFEIDPRVQWRRSYEFSAPAWYTETKNYHLPSKERVESCSSLRPNPKDETELREFWPPGTLGDREIRRSE